MAVEYCIRHDILKDFLMSHKAEVRGMILTEYNEEETLNRFKKEYKEEGREEKELEDIKNLASNLSISLDEARKLLRKPGDFSNN